MAGFFGLFDYSRPGKGVSKDEPRRSRFVHFFVLLQRKFWKIIQLNFLFLLFCIPIVTIGPAVAGMTYVLRNFANERPVFLFSDFWDAFKSNLKQSLIYELIFAVTAYALWVSWQFYFNGAGDNALLYVPAVLIFLMTILFLFANFYIFLMIVTIDLPLKSIIKNGFLLSILGMKNNLLTTLLVAVTMFALWFVYILGYMLYILIGFAFIAFIIVYNAYPVIKKYTIDPFNAQNTDGGAKNNEENIFSDEYQKQDDNQ